MNVQVLNHKGCNGRAMHESQGHNWMSLCGGHERASPIDSSPAPNGAIRPSPALQICWSRYLVAA